MPCTILAQSRATLSKFLFKEAITFSLEPNQRLLTQKGKENYCTDLPSLFQSLLPSKIEKWDFFEPVGNAEFWTNAQLDRRYALIFVRFTFQ
jgi:hypothetical protein